MTVFFLLVIVCIAAALLQPRFRAARFVSAAAAVAILLWAWPPLEALFSGTLEWWFRASPLPSATADAIVVLSASVFPADPSQPEDMPGHGTYLRCARAAWLYHHWKPLPIVVSGGPLRTSGPITLAAPAMARTLEEAGIPSSLIWIEDRSHTTYENALYTAALLRPRGIRRIALVTEGYHLLRSVKCFEHQGLAVVPVACSYRTLRFHAALRQFLPTPQEMVYNEETLHEWIGLVWYAVRGRI